MRGNMIARRITPLIIGLLVFQSGSASVAGTALTPHTAEYKVKISVLGGTLLTHLERTADGYRADSSIEATGLSRILAHGAIRENSEFIETENGVRPLRFQSADTLSKGGETVDFTFDWQDREIVGTIDGADFHTDIEGMVHDRVSLQYGLMHDLNNGIQRSTYSLQDAEKLKPLQITNIGSKKVKVPFGTFEAIGIQHQTEGSSRVTTLWCVEELGFLPVIIEQHRNGKLQVRAVLTAYTPS